ncbi:MAG: DUF1559 domain-containing protein [Gemmataceae bacterium]|nr:DUF1559 domain-containing protein [Gemmataceae bacterium]
MRRRMGLIPGDRRGGLTLIEVLVVIAIVGVLIGLVIPAVQRVRDAAARTQCSNNLRQIGLALHQYHQAHGSLPPGVSYRDGADPHPFMSWNARLLPYLEQNALWEQSLQAYAQDPVFLHNPPHTGSATVVPVYGCPSDGRTLAVGDKYPRAFTAYLGVEGTGPGKGDGLLFLDSRVRFANITDGTSTTLLVGERPPSEDQVFGWWYAGEGQEKDGSCDMVLNVREVVRSPYGPGCPFGPYNFKPGRVSNQCDAFHFWSLHINGAHFLFADGSVRFLSYSADPLFPALASRSGGEATSVP